MITQLINNTFRGQYPGYVFKRAGQSSATFVNATDRDEYGSFHMCNIVVMLTADSFTVSYDIFRQDGAGGRIHVKKGSYEGGLSFYQIDTIATIIGNVFETWSRYKSPRL